ncbi:MAG: HAMP domain-containing histidine kinase [Clostridiales bacterium]|nr:HAMP domain-containing histidine kinase [Clostridiales bacterium]
MSSNAKKPQSVLFRTTLSLAVGTILVFLVLILVFYRQTTVSLISENERRIERQAESLALAYDSLMADASVSESAVQAFINSFARTEQVSVWFVRSDGRIEYSTSVPDFMRGDILKADNYVFLTNERVLDLFLHKGAAQTSDVTNGLFANSRSVAVSVAVPTAQKDLNIVLFNTLNVEHEVFWRLSNALLLPILISFAMALLFFSLMARSLIRPLRALSDAATSVTKGDLSVRVDVPELRKESTLKYMLTDEITNMVSTVNSMIDRLEHQEADRKVFISSIAHDLRTPLTSIKGFLSAISDGTIPPENYPKYMDIIQTQVERIQKLINSMTEASSLSQIDESKMEDFDINEMIRDAVQDVENLVSEKTISVNVDLGTNHDKQMMVFGESQLQYRVFYNLLTNAIKFTPQDGIIGISTSYNADEEKVYVTIEDSGCGIPEDKLDRVFESFYKVDPSRTESGFGLGLYICREIITAHGEKIWAEKGEELGGAKFVYTIKTRSEKPEEKK